MRLLTGAPSSGSVDGPSELQDGTPWSVFPPTLLDAGDVGVSATMSIASLTPGSTIGDLRSQLDGLPDASQFAIDRGDWVPAEVRAAVNAQGQALAILAGDRGRRHDGRGRAASQPPVPPRGGRASPAQLDRHDPRPGRRRSTGPRRGPGGRRDVVGRRPRVRRLRPLPPGLRAPRRAAARPPVRCPDAPAARALPSPSPSSRGCSWRSPHPEDERPGVGRVRSWDGAATAPARAGGDGAPLRVHSPGRRLDEAEGCGGGHGGHRRRPGRRLTFGASLDGLVERPARWGEDFDSHPRAGRRRVARRRAHRAGKRSRHGGRVVVRGHRRDPAHGKLRRHGRAADAWGRPRRTCSRAAWP